MNEKIKRLQKELQEIRSRMREFLAMTDEQRTVEIKNEMIEKDKRVEEIEKEIELEKKLIETEKRLSAAQPAILMPDSLDLVQITNIKEPPIYRSIGEQMMDIIAVENKSLHYRQQKDAQTRLEKVFRASGLSEGVGSDGGFLLQDNFVGSFVETLFTTGLLLPRCRIVNVSSGSNNVKLWGINETSRATGSRWGGVIVYRTAEAAEKLATKPAFREIKFEVAKLTALCYATDELLEDAAQLESWIRMAFTDEMNFTVDDELIRGTGAGQMLGILNSACLITVAKKTGQVAKTILYDNILAMWSRLMAISRANAVWYINQDVEPQLQQMSLVVGTGGIPVYLPPGGATSTPYSTLLGRPVIPIEQAETCGTKGDIILADFSKYLIGRKSGIQTATSVHVKFIYDETCFRFLWRISGLPLYASAITPYKGSNTISPFITLASRE